MLLLLSPYNFADCDFACFCVCREKLQEVKKTQEEEQEEKT